MRLIDGKIFIDVNVLTERKIMSLMKINNEKQNIFVFNFIFV